MMAAGALTARGSLLACELEEDDKADDCALHAVDSKTYALSECAGVRPVVIAFFPKAFTGG